MVGLFCFDGPLYKDKDGIYCNVTLTNEMFARYFTVVDKLYVVVRTFSVDKTFAEMNMKPLELKNMEVIEAGNFYSIKCFRQKKEFQKTIKGILELTDLGFARMPSQTSNVVLEVAQKMGMKYLVEVGGCAWDSFWNHGVLGKIVAPYMYLTAKQNIKKASFATYVTKEFLQKRYPNYGVQTNCSNVYLSTTDKDVLIKRIEKIDKMDPLHPVIGQAVNSIDVKYKGEHLIIRTMGELKKKGIIAEFQVVGPGTGDFLRSEARKHGVSKQLTIIGTLKKEEMTNWYKSIDIYVQPSKQEGLPRSVIEAMSTACPAIGSSIAGIPELIDRDYLFNPNDIKQIQNVIVRLLSEKNNMKIQATTNFSKSKEYNIEDIENRRQEVFRAYQETVKREKNK